jgi:hypothetical protein
LRADEVAWVLRRAAELEAENAAAAGTDPSHDFSASVVIEAAEEVGLSPVAVRQALAELRIGPPAVAPGTPAVTESRVVAATPAAVLAEADRFLRRRAFQQRRRQGHWALYRERRDPLRHLQRIFDGGGARQLVGVSAVLVTISPVADAGTMVRLEATLDPGRRGVATTAAASGVVGVTALATLATGDIAPLVVGVPAGAAIGAAGWQRRRQWRQRRHVEVSETLAALLDRLG